MNLLSPLSSLLSSLLSLCLCLSVSLSLSLSVCLSVSLSLCLCVSVSLSLSQCCREVLLSCVVVWCVDCVVCAVLCCGVKRWKNRVDSKKKRLRVYVQNVPVYAGTTRTRVESCARGASTHWDVSRVHMATCLSGHTGEGVIVSSAYQNLPTYGYHVLWRFTKRTPCIFRIFKFENRSNTERSRFL